MGTSSFRIDFLRVPFLAIGAFGVGLAIWSLYHLGFMGLIVAITPLLVALPVGWYFGVVHVDDSKITLYRTTSIKWLEISRLKTANILGLPYLLVWRRWPWPEFVPLYTSGDTPLLEHLAMRAPQGTLAATWLQRSAQEAPPPAHNAA